MKKRDLVCRFILSFLCGGAIALGNLFCIITAFDIPVDVSQLVTMCLFAALFCSVLHLFEKALLLRIAIFVIVLLLLLTVNWTAVKRGYLLAYQTIMTQFIDAYKMLSDVELTTFVPYGTQATLFMALVGMVLAFLASWTVSRRSRLWIIAIVSVPLLWICLLITDAPPAVLPVLLLTGTYILLAITQSRRRVSVSGNHAMALCLILPLILLISGVASHTDPANYVRSDWMERVRDSFKDTMERYAFVQRNASTGEWEFVSPFVSGTLGDFSWNSDTTETDLSAIGSQKQTGRHVMSVYSDKTETVYLKGNAFALYEDNRWLSLDQDAYSDTQITESIWRTDVTVPCEIQIKTDSRSSILYLPYMLNDLPEKSEIYYDLYVRNKGNLTEYKVRFAADNSDSFTNEQGLSMTNESYEAFVQQTYTQVPMETLTAIESDREKVIELIERESSIDSDTVVAEVVANYVRTSAAYSLDTERMPDGDDFVRWFLQDSDTGYCVHFATAATILLRSLDIPARYVVGYKVDTEAGEWADVTQDDAHAWVEYYIDGVGWRMLETTPSSSNTEQNPSDNEPSESYDSPNDSEPKKDQTDPQGGLALPGFLPGGEYGGQTTGRYTGFVTAFGVLTALIVFVFVWSILVRKLRTVIFKRGTINNRTIAYYHHIAFMSKFAKETVPERINDLALKARFSQHTIAENELKELKSLSDELTSKLLSNRKPLHYVLHHFIFAL